MEYITLYHGTASPLTSLKKHGLKVFGVDWIYQMMMDRAKNPAKVGPLILEILQRVVHPPYGIYFSTDPEVAEGYIAIPEELGFQFLFKPKRLSVELLKLLVETEGDLLIGKLVTVEVPKEWSKDPRVSWGPSNETYIPWDVGPQYITNIKIINSSWREALEWIEEIAWVE